VRKRQAMLIDATESTPDFDDMTPGPSRIPSPSNNKRQKLIISETESEDFCCGVKHYFSPLPIVCFNECIIGPYMKYRSNDEYIFCERCFATKKGKKIRISNKYVLSNKYIGIFLSNLEFFFLFFSRIMVNKADFKKFDNDEAEEEPVVSCADCGVKKHAVCALYNETIFERYTIILECRMS
jgi:hypothetical protein